MPLTPGLPHLVLPPRPHLSLLDYSCGSFCIAKQIHLGFLLPLLFHTKDTLFVHYCHHLTLFPGNHFTSILRASFLFFQVIVLHCVHVLQFILSKSYIWALKQLPIINKAIKLCAYVFSCCWKYEGMFGMDFQVWDWWVDGEMLPAWIVYEVLPNPLLELCHFASPPTFNEGICSLPIVYPISMLKVKI